MAGKIKEPSPKPALGPVVPRIPEGDDRQRMTCTDCGFIHYDNPKVVAGAVCDWQGQVLLCRRAIEPRIGFWTIPAGYLELGETIAEGAKREVFEEAGAIIGASELLGIFEIPRISQIYVVHRAGLVSPELNPGPESLEAALFDWPEIPWTELAFPSVKWSLDIYRSGQTPAFKVFQPERGGK